MRYYCVVVKFIALVIYFHSLCVDIHPTLARISTFGRDSRLYILLSHFPYVAPHVQQVYSSHRYISCAYTHAQRAMIGIYARHNRDRNCRLRIIFSLASRKSFLLLLSPADTCVHIFCRAIYMRRTLGPRLVSHAASPIVRTGDFSFRDWHAFV